MRLAIDTNVLVYTFDRSDSGKHEIAIDLVARAAIADCVIPTQVFGEFLNVVRRKNPALVPEAIRQVSRWGIIFPTLDTNLDHISRGAQQSGSHKLQMWDSIIWQVACASGAEIFLSEDFQDGFSLDGMRVLNPFKSRNADIVQSLLAQSTDSQ